MLNLYSFNFYYNILIYFREDDSAASDVFVPFSWYKLTYILDSVSSVHQENVNEVIYGLSTYINEFLSVNIKIPSEENFEKRVKSRFRVPDGNTILSMYGKWLFDAAKLSAPGYVSVFIFCDLIRQEQRKEQRKRAVFSVRYSAESRLCLLKKSTLVSSLM